MADDVEGSGEFDEVGAANGDADGPGLQGFDGVAVVELMVANFGVDVVESEVVGGGSNEGPAVVGGGGRFEIDADGEEGTELTS